MKSFTLMIALSLCNFGLISVSFPESQTVKPGEEVTLLSNNMSNYKAVTFWFRLVNRTKASCISVMSEAYNVHYCDGFENGRFNMSTNISTVFLTIKHVNLSDSGLYFWGFYTSGNLNFSVVDLSVEGSDERHDDMDSRSKNESDETAKLTSVLLGALTVCLAVVIIGLVVKIRKLQTANKEEQNPEQNENVCSEDLNYAAVAFQPKAGIREVEPNVIYSATR